MNSSIDIIVRALHSHDKRRKFVEDRFSTADDVYRDEWHARGPFAFWCHLDSANQRAFSDFALREHHRLRREALKSAT